MSMAFADVILSEHPTARLVIVDRRDSPGGHWNDSYPFVRLHQPAAFYGLNSMTLGEGGADPPYAVDPDVSVVPPNGLPQVSHPWGRYVIIGAGKTGIDAILFLLDQGVSPERIQWIVPNDAWLWDRASVQPGFVLATLIAQLQSIVDASSIDEAFLELERQGSMCRVDTGALPTKWRCATINRRELAALRQVEDIVRMGRVERVSAGEIDLEDGAVEAEENSLFIDCSASGLVRSEPQPLFDDGRVYLQSVFMCQQTFSAAMIGRLELLDLSDEKRNEIFTAVPNPERKEDLPLSLIPSVRNLINCQRHTPLWLRRSRLNPAHYDAPHRYLLGAGKLTLLLRSVP
jgi:hypothetical protein